MAAGSWCPEESRVSRRAAEAKEAFDRRDRHLSRQVSGEKLDQEAELARRPLSLHVMLSLLIGSNLAVP